MRLHIFCETSREIALFSQIRLWVLRMVGVTLIAITVNTISGIAVAQEEKKKEDLTNLDISELLKVEIVTGASKFAQKVTEAPASVTIITAEEIKKFGYRTLADVVRSVRGFYVNNDRNYSYVGVRGFSRPGDYNSRVLLLLDGHRVNEPVYDSGLYGTDGLLDIDLIDQIEVIRGPSSSLYGTNAFFGVINVIPKKGAKMDGLQLSVDAGSLDTYRGRISYGKKFDSGADLMLSTSFYDSKGQRRLYYKEFDSPETHNGIYEDNDYDEFNNFFGSLTYRAFTLQSGFYNRKKGIPTGSYGTVFNDRRNKTLDRGTSLDLKYERSFANDLMLTARVGYHGYYYTGDYVYDYAENETPVLVIDRDKVNGKWWGTEVNVVKNVASKHKLNFGSEYRDNFQQDQQNFDVDPYFSYLDDRRDSRVWALYTQDEYAITKKLVLNAGVRFDHYSTFGGTTNPRLGLIYNALKKTWIKLLYGQAFRAPNVYELYYQSNAFKANPNLDPESIKTSEIVLEHYIGDHFRVSASGYYYKIKNLISQQKDPNDGLVFFDNADRVKSKGLEVEFEAKLKNGIEGRGSYVHQRSIDLRSGEELVNSPRNLAYFNVSAPWFNRNLYSGLEVRFVGDRGTLRGEGTDGFWITNLTLLKHRLFKGLELSLSAYNLFDKRYQDPGAEDHIQNGINQDGRTYRLKLTYHFGRVDQSGSK